MKRKSKIKKFNNLKKGKTKSETEYDFHKMTIIL